MMRTALYFTLGCLFAASASAQGKLPLSGGDALVQGQKYFSSSGDHYVIFQSDGNLAVYTSSDAHVWGLDGTSTDYSQAAIVEMGTDGNLVMLDASRGWIWSALSADPDSSAKLVVSDGALKLASLGRGVLWSSDGDLTTPVDLLQTAVFDRLQTEVRHCKEGLEALSSNMYRYPEDPDTAPDGRRAWKEILDLFQQHYLHQCDAVGDFIEAHAGEPIVAKAEAAVTADSQVEGWSGYFTSNVGVISQGQRISAYCPALHRSQFDCVEASRRMEDISIPGALSVLDLISNLECMPDKGWASCRILSDPEIIIMGTAAVSSSAMDMAEEIYTQMTARFKAAYPKSSFDNYVIYMTNGEAWSDLEGLAPVGTMMDPGREVGAGDELRGGTSSEYLWISEQMICKTGVKTRNDAFAEGRRDSKDEDVRTFDQVIHEFGHAIDFKYGLDARIQEVYAGGWNPVEQFPWSIQHWFSSPSGTLSQSEADFIGEIFSSKTTFSCDDYKPDAG